MYYLQKSHSLLCLLALVFLWGTAMGQVQPQATNSPPGPMSPEEFQRSLFPNGGGAMDDHGKYPPVYIDDSRSPGTVIHMKKDMYEYIRNWALQGSNQTVKLDKALERRFDTAEVNDFMLKFASGDSSYFLTPNSGGGTVKASVKGDPICRCKYLTFTEDGSQYGKPILFPTTPTVNHNEPNLPAIGGTHSFYEEAFGAGRAEVSDLELESDGNYVSIDRKTVGSDELNAKATLKIFYFCTADNELPSDCGCDHRLHVEGEFHGDLFSYADGWTSGGLLPAAQANSRAEATFVMAEYTVGETFENITFREAKRKGSFAEFKKEVDPNYLISIIDIAQSFIMNSSPSGTVPGGNFLDAAAQLLKATIGNDTAFVNTGSSASPVPIVGAGTANPMISPGMEKIFVIGSMTKFHHYCKARGAWLGQADATARSAFASAYRLHLILDYDNSPEECCVEKYGMWAHGGYELDLLGNGEVAFNTDPSGPLLSNIQSNLVTNMGGAWENFDPNLAYGTSAGNDPNEVCDCNVRGNFDIIDTKCNSVIIDVSGSVYANNYYIQIGESDAQGNYLQGSNTWVGSWFSSGSVSNQINLASISSPLGAYNFQSGHFYRIGVAVNGHCTGWDGGIQLIQVEAAGKPEFSVVSQACDDVTIDVSATTGALGYRFSVIELDAPAGTSPQTTNLINSLSSNIVSLTDPVGFMNYPFVGGTEYIIGLEIITACGVELEEQVVEIASTATPSFFLEPSCRQYYV